MITLQERIDALSSHGGIVRLGRREKITKPLDLSGRTNIQLLGGDDGIDSMIVADFDKPGPAILGVDLTISTFSGFRMFAKKNVTNAILIGRSEPKRQCYYNTIERVHISGPYGDAVVSTHAAEMLVISRCYLRNDADDATTLRVSSRDGLHGAGGGSNSVISIQDCNLIYRGRHGITVYLDGATQLQWSGGGVMNSHGEAAHEKGSVGCLIENLNGGVISGVKWEASSTETGLLIDGMCERLHLMGGRIQGGNAIEAMATSHLRFCQIDRTCELMSTIDPKCPMVIDGRVEGCLFDVGASP